MNRKHIVLTALATGSLLAPAGIALGQDQQAPTRDPGHREMQRPTATDEPQQQAPTRSRSGTTPDVSAPAQRADSAQEYVVRKGDTLGSIAERTLGSRDQWRTIARANDIDDPSQLEVGRRLTIPSAKEQQQQKERQQDRMRSREEEQQPRSSR